MEAGWTNKLPQTSENIKVQTGRICPPDGFSQIPSILMASQISEHARLRKAPGRGASGRAYIEIPEDLARLAICLASPLLFASLSILN
jgi:hypothetical protein